MDLIIALCSGSAAVLRLYFCHVYKLIMDWIDWNYIFIFSPTCYWAEPHCRIMLIKNQDVLV